MRCFALVSALALAALAPLARAQSAHEVYGAACAAAIAPIPGFDCATGVPVPITIDGAEITDRAPETCDRPGLLDNGPGSDGQCVPFSRILNLSTDTAQVSVMCRQKRFRSADSPEFDEIDVIAHNPATGATCWFQAVGTEAAPVLGTAVPSPTDPDGEGFWAPPETVVAEECGSCHDNDPFMYSPFVGQVWGHVPTNPLGPYAHVDAGFGFSDWPTHEMQPRAHTCLGCHRIGTGVLTPPAAAAEKPGSCGQLATWMTGAPAPGTDEAAHNYPLSHAMPPYFGLPQEVWEETYGASLAAVQSCCADPAQPFCNIREIRSYLEEGPVP